MYLYYTTSGLQYLAVAKVRSKHVRYAHIALSRLIVFQDSYHRPTEGECRSIVGMNKLQSILSANTCSEPPGLVISHVISRVCLAVFTLAWQPDFHVDTAGVRFANVGGALH